MLRGLLVEGTFQVGVFDTLPPDVYEVEEATVGCPGGDHGEVVCHAGLERGIDGLDHAHVLGKCRVAAFKPGSLDEAAGFWGRALLVERCERSGAHLSLLDRWQRLKGIPVLPKRFSFPPAERVVLLGERRQPKD